jgi:hypothetical protein
MPKVGGRRVFDELFRKNIEPIKKSMKKSKKTCQRVFPYLNLGFVFKKGRVSA